MKDLICWDCEKELKSVFYIIPYLHSPHRGSGLTVCYKCKNKYDRWYRVERK